MNGIAINFTDFLEDDPEVLAFRRPRAERPRHIMDRNQLCTSPPKNSGTRQFSPVPLCIIVVVSV